MWLMVIAMVLFYLCAYQSRTPIAARQWEKRLRTYMCLGSFFSSLFSSLFSSFPSFPLLLPLVRSVAPATLVLFHGRFLVHRTENDALSSMAEYFADLFHIREIGHRLVATDIAVGFVLIRTLQAKREITGHIQEITAGHSTTCPDGNVPQYDPNCARLAKKVMFWSFWIWVFTCICRVSSPICPERTGNDSEKPNGSLVLQLEPTGHLLCSHVFQKHQGKDSCFLATSYKL